MSDDPRSLYRHGLCDVMALALAQCTGLPLGLIGGERPSPHDKWEDESSPEIDFEPCHAVVIVDLERKLWIDVDGLHEGIDPHRFMFSEPVEHIVLRSATEEEVTEAFTVEDIDEQQIEQALAFIQDDDILQGAVEYGQQAAVGAINRLQRRP